MDSLLRWSIENSVPTAQGTTITPRTDLDPGIIDHILGKPDAVLMKEALEVAVDENRDEDDRLQALEDLEMLVGNIDNANDLAKLKMWEPLHALLTSNSSEKIKLQSLWAIGTAVQNNPSAQDAYLSLHPIPTVLSFLSSSVGSWQLRAKAVYALSGLCTHNSAALQQLEKLGGWDVFRSALEDSEIRVRRKITFLLNSLLTPSDFEVAQNATPGLHTVDSPSAPIHANSHASMLRDPNYISTSGTTLKALEEGGLLKALLSALTVPVPFGKDGDSYVDVEFEENVIHLLCTYLSLRPAGFTKDLVSESELAQLKKYVEEEISKAGGKEKLRDIWGLDAEKFNLFVKSVRIVV